MKYKNLKNREKHMLKVLILEDEQNSREGLAKIIKEVDSKIEISMAASYEEAKQLLVSEGEFHLFFLDVNLDPSDKEEAMGIRFAQKIRAEHRYEFTPIVFITSIVNKELDAYRQIQCYRYIIKPFQVKEVEAILDKVLKHHFVEKNEERKSIFLKIEGVNYRIYLDEIKCVKAINRGIQIFLTKEQVTVKYVTIKQLLPKLPQDTFFQCHRMYVVNKNYIDYTDYVNRLIALKDCEEMAEIGTTYKNRIKEWLDD
ncbi:MAG: LytTR family DNA-binding domain-containing protein [Lachnospiraceae bacterium]|nr:LytTR family DNA-binding domain-containing protein [Lachnospiraceae bacterium]